MQVNCNASGDHGSDIPVLIPDNGPTVQYGGPHIPGVWESNNRCLFIWSADIRGGATLFWSNKSQRVLMPMQAPGAVEGDAVGFPALVYGAVSNPKGLLSVRPGDGFIVDGKPFLWKGATFLRGAARVRDGEDIRPQLDQILAAGGNTVRMSAMLKWANFGPHQPGYWDAIEHAWDVVDASGLRLQWTVFERDTRDFLPSQDQQLAVWTQTIERIRRRCHVVPDLINEFDTVPGVDPFAFPRPAGLCASRGSGGTDSPYVRPPWDFAPYHVRRDPPPDSRGFAQGDHFGWETDYPKVEIVLPEEWIKPPAYSFNPDYAFRMGQRAGINGGGTFHSDEGVQAVYMSGEVVGCMKAFFDGCAAAWRYRA